MTEAKEIIYELVHGNNIIDELLGHPTEFTDVRMYGSREDPLFYAKDVGKILGIRNVRDSISNYSDILVKRKCVVELIEKRGTISTKITRKVNMLTEFGLYRIIGSSRSKICDKLWVFIGIVLKKLRLQGEVRLKEAQDELHKQLHSLRMKNMNQDAVIINNQILLDQSKYLREMFGEDEEQSFEHEGDDTTKMMMLLQATFLKKYYIYLVNPKFVEKKVKNPRPKTRDQAKALWEKEEIAKKQEEGLLPGEYMGEFGYLQPEDVDDQDVFHYYITSSRLDSKNYNFMERIYLPSPAEFKNFKASIKKFEAAKDVFLMTRTALKDAADIFNGYYLKGKLKTIEEKEKVKQNARKRSTIYDVED